MSYAGNRTRVSLSLPEELVRGLDAMVESRGFDSRSQAAAEMIASHLVNHQERFGSEVMAGTITLIYERNHNSCPQRIAEIQAENVVEIISSLHVNLESLQVMEVMLVQGPAQKLKYLADRMIAVKGVKTGKLNLNTAILPPLHKRQEQEARHV